MELLQQKCSLFLEELEHFERSDRGKLQQSLLQEKEKFYLLTLDECGYTLSSVFAIVKLYCADITYTSCDFEKFFLRQKLFRIFTHPRVRSALRGSKDTQEEKKMMKLVSDLRNCHIKSRSHVDMVFVECNYDLMCGLEEL